MSPSLRRARESTSAKPSNSARSFVEREQHASGAHLGVEHRARAGERIVQRRAGAVVAVGRLGQVQYDVPARRQHAPHLVPIGPPRRGRHDVLVDEDVQQHVDRAVLGGQPVGEIVHEELGVPGARACPFDRRRGAIEPGHPQPLGGGVERVAPGPAARVEPARAAEPARERPDHRARRLVAVARGDPSPRVLRVPAHQASRMTIQPAMATKCATAARITNTWKISWKPNVRGHGFGRPSAKITAPTV